MRSSERVASLSGDREGRGLCTRERSSLEGVICGGGRLRSAHGGSLVCSAVSLGEGDFTEPVGRSLTAPISAKLGMGVFGTRVLGVLDTVADVEEGGVAGGLELEGCGIGVLGPGGRAGGRADDGIGKWVL